MTALGMVMGMLLTRLCTGSHLAAWLSFAVLTLLHVWANLRAMRCLVLTSVNQPRLDALLQAYDTNVSNRRAWRCGVLACSPGHLCRPPSTRQSIYQRSPYPSLCLCTRAGPGADPCRDVLRRGPDTATLQEAADAAAGCGWPYSGVSGGRTGDGSVAAPSWDPPWGQPEQGGGSARRGDREQRRNSEPEDHHSEEAGQGPGEQEVGCDSRGLHRKGWAESARAGGG